MRKNLKINEGGAGVELMAGINVAEAALGPLVHRGYGNTRRFLDVIPTPARSLSQKGIAARARDLPPRHVT